MAINRKELLDPVEDIIARKSKEVLTLGWDGDASVMSGAVTIKTWKGVLFTENSDVEEDGPFSSLADALASELFQVATSNPELSSRVLSMKELKAFTFRAFSPPGSICFVSGAIWVCWC